MIEVTPRQELPVWPEYLDGNQNLYEPQQLEYLDGNLSYVGLVRSSSAPHMIEVTPTLQLPIWPEYLDGNQNLYEPQQLEYLDGNLRYLHLEDLNFEHKAYLINNGVREAFNFEPNGEAILCTNDTDFTISGNTIAYHSKLIDLDKEIQQVEDLIVIKAKTNGFYVWTTPTDFGSFLVQQGVYKQNINSPYLDSDFTFCELFPIERKYTLISQIEPKFKVRGFYPSAATKTSGDRPLCFLRKKPIVRRANSIDQQYKNNYPWKSDGVIVEIKSIALKLKCFILVNNKFYWANLTFKEIVNPIFDNCPIEYGLYTITNLSYTKTEKVRSYGDKLIVVKEYNTKLADKV